MHGLDTCWWITSLTHHAALGDLFGECYVYHLGENSPDDVVTKSAGKKENSSKVAECGQHKEIRKISERCVIIEMYTTSRSSFNLSSGSPG